MGCFGLYKNTGSRKVVDSSPFYLIAKNDFCDYTTERTANQTMKENHVVLLMTKIK